MMTFFVVMIGLGLLAFLSGLFSRAVTKDFEKQKREGTIILDNWAVWPWNRCAARTERYERCDLKRHAHGDHALERGFDIPRWSTDWTQ